MAIHLLGTNHISSTSASSVERLIGSGEYDIIALELDKQRLAKLLNPDQKQPSVLQMAKTVGVSGALFIKLGGFVQKRLGGRFGVEPGVEMLAAVKSAQKHNRKLALIDRPITKTLQRFSKAFTFREKMRLLKSMFRFRKIDFELDQTPTPEQVEEIIKVLDETSPALSRTLIHERNQYMVAQLIGLQKKFPDNNILAVVGAGHVPGMHRMFISQKTVKENKLESKDVKQEASSKNPSSSSA